MREILFRGKRADNGEWAYGYYVAFPNGQHIIVGDSYCNYVYVQPETVGQYTGMKDATGKRIFEGDILANEKKIAAIAEYCTTMFRLRRVDDNYTMTWGATKHLKVIGNIHDMTMQDGKVTPNCQWLIDNCCAIILDKESEESENE